MDYFLLQKINSLVGQWVYLDTTGIFFAKYLGYVLAGLVFFIFWKKWKIISQIFLAAVIARLGIVGLVRWLWPRQRPFIENQVNLLFDKANEASFPSGHAAFFFALSTVIFFYNKKAGIGFFLASFLISISRVFTGVHWPSDILAGAMVGIFSGWLVVKVFKKF